MKERLYYYLYKIQERWWRYRSKNSKVDGYCLVFHHITDTHIDDWANVQCTPSNFKDILLSFQQKGYCFVGLKEGLKLANDKSDCKFVMVTFDDVPSSVYYNAYPIMKEMEVPFTLFVTSSFIDCEGYLSAEQLYEMSTDHLCTIGAHTLTHPRLRDCRDLNTEFLQPKIQLERIVSKPVEYMAYPYGRVNTVSRKAIRMAGRIYKGAFSTVDCKISDFTVKKQFFLPRIPITKPI